MSLIFPISSATGATGISPSNLPANGAFPGASLLGAALPPGTSSALYGTGQEQPLRANRIGLSDFAGVSIALSVAILAAPFFGSADPSPPRAPRPFLAASYGFNPAAFPASSPFAGAITAVPPRAKAGPLWDAPRNNVFLTFSGTGLPVLFIIT